MVDPIPLYVVDPIPMVDPITMNTLAIVVH